MIDRLVYRRFSGAVAATALGLLLAASVADGTSYAQVRGQSYGEGPGASGAAPLSTRQAPGVSGTVEVRSLPRTGDGVGVLDGSGLPVVAAGGALLLVSGLALRTRRARPVRGE